MSPTLRVSGKRKIDAVRTMIRSATSAKKAKMTQDTSQTLSKKGAKKTTTSKARPTNETQTKNHNSSGYRYAAILCSPTPTKPTRTTQELPPPARMPNTVAKKPNLRISPVDQWNYPSSESSSSSAPSSPEDAANPRVFKGTMKDADGRLHYVLKVTQVFHAIDWRGGQERVREVDDQDDQGPLSPKSIPGVRNGDFSLQSGDSGSVFYGVVEGDMELDLETMSSFYPGVLRMYGQRQVP
ncbi:hypothetical protein KC316_g2869 [Hortaea werneckii]|nr:hypothetical protein KC324_g1167 [Hortaea werneckii]KAI7591430.1 hypothetical protein KC316_g2869 [Hortaea werneckii]